MFTVPAITVLTGSIKHTRHPPAMHDSYQTQKNTIELWLCVLGLGFCANYITFLLPEAIKCGAYNQNATGAFFNGLFCIFVLIALARALAIASKRIRFNLLYSIKTATVVFAAGGSAYQFDSTSCLTLHLHLIAIINIGWA